MRLTCHYDASSVQFRLNGVNITRKTNFITVIVLILFIGGYKNTLLTKYNTLLLCHVYHAKEGDKP